MNNTRNSSSLVIGKSGTGIGKSGTGQRFGNCLFGAAAALALVVPLGLAAESPPPFLMDAHEGVLTLTLHDQGRVISGQASLSQASGGLIRVPMHSLELPGESDSGRSPKRRVGCDGLLYHGSGSGGQSVGDIGTVMYHGSGSGGQSVGPCGDLMYHGSGSGGQSVGDTGTVMYHGSGSGGQSVGACEGLMYHGSGSGGQSVGDTGTVMYHGSGSGGQSVGRCKPAQSLWGYAELVAGADDFNLIVFRLDQGGPTEHLIVSADRSVNNRVSNIWAVEP
ncbi:MAG: hypothetical protein JJU31_09235 [Wenzhouxiangella sp.]|nr:hypothetical protein [Wenzhouxiangella sp.]MCH8476955.1 hypothetical protein [Wenzhouxiangella sp.]TVR93396.1 MAG: hypothetical protein EA418_12080 [Wenzhouxiangellaceae bacterium]